MEWEKKNFMYKCKVTNDLLCIVAWHLLKRDRVVRSIPKPHSKSQFLKPSQNQYRWKGHIIGDEESRYFFSDNVELVKRLVLNHARNLIRKRLVAYQEIITGGTYVSQVSYDHH